VLGLASLAVAGLLASDAVSGRFVDRPGTAVDVTGQMSIALPDGWRASSGPWPERPDTGGHRGSALLLSPDPARWSADPTVPGAFIGLSRVGDSALTPAEFLALRRQQQAGCTAAPARTSRQAGVDWRIADFRDCPDGRARIIEAVGTRPGATGLVYVEVTPPAGSPPAFTDALLAGLRLR
jgi:hypothetical protein